MRGREYRRFLVKMFAGKPSGMPVEPLARAILPPPSGTFSTLTITSSLVFAVGAAISGLSSLALSTFLSAVTIYTTTLYATTIGSATSLVSAIYATGGVFQLLQTVLFSADAVRVGSTGEWTIDTGSTTTTLRTTGVVLTALKSASGAVSSVGTSASRFTSGFFSSLDADSVTSATASVGSLTSTTVSANAVNSASLTVTGVSNQSSANFSGNVVIGGGPTASTGLITQPYVNIRLAKIPLVPGARVFSGVGLFDIFESAYVITTYVSQSYLTGSVDAFGNFYAPRSGMYSFTAVLYFTASTSAGAVVDIFYSLNGVRVFVMRIPISIFIPVSTQVVVIRYLNTGDRLEIYGDGTGTSFILNYSYSSFEVTRL